MAAPLVTIVLLPGAEETKDSVPAVTDDSLLLRVKQYLQCVAVGNEIHAGTMPPRGRIIEGAPKSAARLLSFFSESRSRAAARDALVATGHIDESLFDSLVGDLERHGVLSTFAVDPADRFSRHALYYDLVGADGATAQRVLSESTVGLVGMGGIGSNVAAILAAAGVGRLIFSDGDRIELSNLTRQPGYSEGDIGRRKVDVVAERLRALNSSLELVPIAESIAGTDHYDRHFADAALVVLSADEPTLVHEWTNDAALRLGFSYSNAGYIESYGVVGPLVIPGNTACYGCTRTVGGDDPGFSRNLNRGFQAASYGPLNLLVGAIQANEVIRVLLGLPVATRGNRLLVSSIDYSIIDEEFSRSPSCRRCGPSESAEQSPRVDLSLRELYAIHYEDSFNALLLDPLIEELVRPDTDSRVLDVGCATGHQSLRLAQRGAQVLANDTDAGALDDLQRDAAALGVEIATASGDVRDLDLDEFDWVLCLNVLDHVDDMPAFVARLASLCSEDGRALISVPHPLKGRGAWKKEHRGDKAQYRSFIADRYFQEERVARTREDRYGNVVARSIATYHRTLETYFATFDRAGFTIVDLREPRPPADAAVSQPVLYEKCSRIPYFLVFVLEKSKSRLVAPGPDDI